MKLKDIILESIDLGDICYDNLCVYIIKTNHAIDRSNYRQISDSIITSLIEKAMPFLNIERKNQRIKSKLVTKDGQYYHFFDKNNDNVVGALKYNMNSNKYEFHITTVINKHNFKVFGDTITIKL
jgi:hypothetical protein